MAPRSPKLSIRFKWHIKQTINFSIQRNTPLTAGLALKHTRPQHFLLEYQNNGRVAQIKSQIIQINTNHTMRSCFGSLAWLAFEGSEAHPTSWRRQSEVMLFIERSNSSHVTASDSKALQSSSFPGLAVL